jgi:hypothetical protein
MSWALWLVADYQWPKLGLICHYDAASEHRLSLPSSLTSLTPIYSIVSSRVFLINRGAADNVEEN